MNKQRLFTASCIALIATAMSFAIRGDIMGDFESIFQLNKTNVGWIAGAAFWGFGLSIFIGGPLCDVLGMGTIMRLAAAGHIGGHAAHHRRAELPGAVSGDRHHRHRQRAGRSRGEPAHRDDLRQGEDGQAHGAARLVPRRHRHRRRAGVPLHADRPRLAGQDAADAGAVGRSTRSCSSGQTFPPTERVAAGVSFGDMFKEALRPLFLVIWVGMMLTAATELGPGQWYANVFNEVMASTAQAGILVLVWVNGIMYLMRQFGGDISHKVSPVGADRGDRGPGRRRPVFLQPRADARRRPSPRRRCWPSAPRSGGRRCWGSPRSGSRAPARWGWRSSAAPAASRPPLPAR